MSKISSLLKFLSSHTKRLGVGEHVFVVGGAVRNHLLGLPAKDVDIVVDSVALGRKKDSAWLAQQLSRAIPAQTKIATNQYGVAILSVSGSWILDGHELEGEVLEIANARKESYGDPSGKGYKPHMVEPSTIEEDLCRREFTFNTLLWRLSDLENGPDQAEILDLLGVGRKHLEERVLSTPSNPDKTFSDDPTRMLRAVKFVARFGFEIPNSIQESIRNNAHKLVQMPWDAVRKILVEDIMEGQDPRKSLVLLHELGLGSVLKEMLVAEPGFSAAVSRSLGTQDIHLILDLLIDFGWVLKTPVSFLSLDECKVLRSIFRNFGNSEKLLEALKRPSINQVRLFELFQLKGRERSKVTSLARSLLLKNPNLAGSPELLEHLVELALKA